MFGNHDAMALRRRESVKKAHKNALKARLNDTIFQRNINNINQLQRNVQYHPPRFYDPRISRAICRFVASRRPI
jgi:hypothetical protein